MNQRESLTIPSKAYMKQRPELVENANHEDKRWIGQVLVVEE